MKKFEEGDIFVNKIKTHPKVKFFCYDGKIYQNNTLEENIALNNFLPEPPAPSVPISVVEDGLVVHLDASNTSSYSGAGSTWYDLTSNNLDFNLENSPTYNTDNGGYFEFDGSNQALSSIASTSGINDFDGTNDYSLEIWFNANSSQPGVTSNYVAIIEKWNNSGGTAYPYALRYHVPNGVFQMQAYDASNSGVAYVSASTEQWVQIVGSFDWTNDTLYLYKNGELSTHPWGGTEDISAITNSVSNSLNTTVAKRSTSGFYLAGGIAIFRIYDKALSSTEVLQNYNANKDRFGL